MLMQVPWDGGVLHFGLGFVAKSLCTPKQVTFPRFLSKILWSLNQYNCTSILRGKGVHLYLFVWEQSVFAKCVNDQRRLCSKGWFWREAAVDLISFCLFALFLLPLVHCYGFFFSLVDHLFISSLSTMLGLRWVKLISVLQNLSVYRRKEIILPEWSMRRCI